jgi:O-methyltransferase
MVSALLKLQAQKALLPILYRYPPFGLQPERLAVYLMGLLNRREMNLPVAEVGCHLGGTTVIAYTALRRTGWASSYTCFDTFGGFVDQQFKADAALGTPADKGKMFTANSSALVRGILDYHECPDVRLVQGDITTVPEKELAPRYGVVLLDIDLSEPTYIALQRFWPRLAAGGAIYVDDCPKNSDWKARKGYARFCADIGLAERYEFGLGILEKAAT